MHSLIINGTKFLVEDNSPLREALENAAFYFPCGGNGKCGKCRIVCRDLAPTDLDRRFLSETAIADGVRIACDKRVTDSLEITCEITEKKENIKLRECSVAVSVTDEEIDICIIGEEPVETVTKRNPLADYTLETLAVNYEKNPSFFTNALRAVIGKECVELFEKYGAAKATVLAVGAKGLYLKILSALPLDADEEAVEKASENLSGLPTESLYFLPYVGDFIGGEILSETIKLKENSLLVDCEKTVVLFSIGEEDDIATAIWDCDYSEVALRCITAAVKFMQKENPSTVYLCGKYADKTEDALNSAGITAIQTEKSISGPTAALLSYRTRAKLLKEKNRTTPIKIYDNEDFQKILTDE